MTTGIIIQARYNSSRLKGKVLFPLGDMSVLEHVVATCCMSIADKVILATSTDPANDTIVDLVSSFSYRYRKLSLYRYHGDDNDVLSRYYNCAKENSIDTIIRITSDCPIISKDIINICINIQKKYSYDYFAFLPVDGLDTEILTFQSLEKAHNECIDKTLREHVTLYIRQNPQKFNCNFLENIKLSIDEASDLDNIKDIFF